MDGKRERERINDIYTEIYFESKRSEIERADLSSEKV